MYLLLSIVMWTLAGVCIVDDRPSWAILCAIAALCWLMVGVLAGLDRVRLLLNVIINLLKIGR